MTQPLLQVKINGKEFSTTQYDPTAPLAQTLREVFNLRGTKVACGQGNCGACTVTVKVPGADSFRAVNSCLFATGGLLAADGEDAALLAEVNTIEGVAANDPIALAIADNNGSQCGFCTPGIVMKAKAFQDDLKGSKPSLIDIEDVLCGNLCRCTGYRPILYALKTTLGDNADNRLADEIRHTPACVVRGPDGNYPLTYANGGVKSENVLQINEVAQSTNSPIRPKKLLCGVRSATPVHAEPVAAVSLQPELAISLQAYEVAYMMAEPPALLASEAAADAPVEIESAAVEGCANDDIAFMEGAPREKSEASSHENEPPHPEERLHKHLATARRVSDVAYTAAYLGKNAASHHAVAISQQPTAIPSQIDANTRWFAPTTEAQLTDKMNSLGKAACIVAGNVNSCFIPLTAKSDVSVFVSLNGIKSLNNVEVKKPDSKTDKTKDTIVIPANVTITQLSQFLKTTFPASEGEASESKYSNIIGHLNTIGNTQVRNLSTLVGNLVAARIRVGPTDIGLIFASMGATVQIASSGSSSYYNVFAKGTNITDVSVYDFLNNKATAGEKVPANFDKCWVRSVTVTLDKDITFTRVAARVENHPALSAVAYDKKNSKFWCVGVKGANAGSKAHIDNQIVNTWVTRGKNETEQFDSIVKDLETVFPNTADPKLRASRRLLQGLCGRLLGLHVIPDIVDTAGEELVDKTKNGFVEVSKKTAPVAVSADTPSIVDIHRNPSTLLKDRKEAISSGSQKFYVDTKASPVSEPVIKAASYEQAIGKAVYVQDVRPPQGTYHATYILTTNTIVSFDPFKLKTELEKLIDEQLLKREGKPINEAVILTAHDIMNCGKLADSANTLIREHKSDAFSAINKPGAFGEFILAPGFTTFAGQGIALVLHPDEYESRRIAKIVQGKVERVMDKKETWTVSGTTDEHILTDLSGVDGLMVLDLEKSIQYVKDNAEKKENARTAAYLKAKQDIVAQDSDPTAAGVDDYFITDLKNVTVARGDRAMCQPGKEAEWRSSFAESESEPDRVIASGEVWAGSQNHFYMETQTAMVVPEEDRFVAYCGTQTLSDQQNRLVKLLKDGLVNSVVVSNVRIGGGFGGKEPQAGPTASAALAAAVILNAPVRVLLDRQTDLELIGKRHAFKGTYKVAIDSKTGKMTAMDLDFAGDAGCSHDCSLPVLELAALTADNMYNIPNFRCSATPYLTHKQTGTAFRSFGVVQSMTIVESAVEHALYACNKKRVENALSPLSAAEFREINFYNPPTGACQSVPRTPFRYNAATQKFDQFGQELFEVGNMLGDKGVWDLIQNQGSEYVKAVQSVKEFNSKNKYRKQGVAIMPLKYGISFTVVKCNQGSCNVSAFNGDGSIIIQTAGVEMGQGLHTKITQTAAAALDVPMNLIRIGPVSTDTAANGPGTGASVGADLNLPALVDACGKLKKRLQACQDETLFDLINDAVEYRGRVDDEDEHGDKLQEHDHDTNKDELQQLVENFQISRAVKEYLNSEQKKSTVTGKVWKNSFEDSCATKTEGWFAMDRFLQKLAGSVPASVASHNALASPANDTSVTDFAKARAADIKLALSWVKGGRMWKDVPSQSFLDNGVKKPEDKPGYAWAKVCANAYNRRVPLLAQGYSKPNADGGEKLDDNNVFFYYNYGAAWTHVEIDCLTGETDVLRTDVIYDAGLSTNAATDIGQIEGGLVQGLGNIITESVTHDPTTGRLNERSIMSYAIPDHRSIPRSLNVQLFWKAGGKAVVPRKDWEAPSVDMKAIKRGKTTGEPPLILAVTALMAARNAVMDARQQFRVGVESFVPLNTPITPQALLHALWDDEPIPSAPATTTK